jgi:hypothetical protein
MGNKTSTDEVVLQPSDSHTCCFELYNDGKTKCWDRSEFGLNKNEYIKQIECGVDFTLFLLSTLGLNCINVKVTIQYILWEQGNIFTCQQTQQSPRFCKC